MNSASSKRDRFLTRTPLIFVMFLRYCICDATEHIFVLFFTQHRFVHVHFLLLFSGSWQPTKGALPSFISSTEFILL